MLPAPARTSLERDTQPGKFEIFPRAGAVGWMEKSSTIGEIIQLASKV
jgi:hypothetical protein